MSKTDNKIKNTEKTIWEEQQLSEAEKEKLKNIVTEELKNYDKDREDILNKIHRKK